MEHLSIRAYDINDLEKCREILHNIQLNDFKWVENSNVKLEDFDHITEGEKVFVACINNEVVAFASIWEADYFLHSLYIDFMYRRYGIGKSLMSFVLDFYKHPMTLKCVKENSKALLFYQSIGWVILKEEMGPEGPYYLLGSNPLEGDLDENSHGVTR